MQVGETLTARWDIRLVRQIARGGMGDVFEARLRGVDGFEKRVAVKFLREPYSSDRRFTRLFAAEARLVCDLVHENIVQIFQLGRRRTGEFYIVMELVEGLTLRAFLDRHLRLRKRVPGPLAVHIASRIARGLAYAHTFRDALGRPMRIVHRDVCPSNILITTEGLAKLSDFGVARALAMPSLGEHCLTGKIPYMAPEQAARRPVDFRADLYALGAVLFEMLAQTTVRPPSADPRRTPFAEIPVPWQALPEGLDPLVEEALRRALDPNPEHRFRDAQEMAQALEYCIYRHGYGPTIQTVEAYLRRHFPELYRPDAARAVGVPADVAAAETVVDASPVLGEGLS